MMCSRAVAERGLIGLCVLSLGAYLFWARPIDVYLSLLGRLFMKTLALAGE